MDIQQIILLCCMLGFVVGFNPLLSEKGTSKQMAKKPVKRTKAKVDKGTKKKKKKKKRPAESSLEDMWRVDKYKMERDGQISIQNLPL